MTVKADRGYVCGLRAAGSRYCSLAIRQKKFGNVTEIRLRPSAKTHTGGQKSATNYVGQSIPAIQAPKPATISPIKDNANGLIVVFRLNARKTQPTIGKNRHPKNHQRFRLYATTRNLISPYKPMMKPNAKSMYPNDTI